MYYSYRKIDGYNCPINLINGGRGIGKTFGAVFKGVRDFVKHGRRFVYVVETLEMVKTLSQNRGEKFFSSIIEFLETRNTCRNRFILSSLQSPSDGTKVTEGDTLNKIKGGTIFINGTTAGYIVAFNDFANIKRNNFVNMGHVIIDEFIPEKIDVRYTQNARKIASLIQSIARTQAVKIYLLANTIRVNDIILVRLGLDNMRVGEFRIIKDDYGSLIAAHYVDNAEYKEFREKADASVSGRFSAILKEDNLEKNEFKVVLPPEYYIPENPKPSHMIFCLHGEMGSVRIHTTKDYAEFYIFSDYGSNKNNRYCFEEKYRSPIVHYNTMWRDALIAKYESGNIMFDSSLTYVTFLNLMKIKVN